MKTTSEQGCPICRQAIYSAAYQTRELPCSVKRHAYLYRCGTCGSNWEIGERSAWEITPDEAAAIRNDDDRLEHFPISLHHTPQRRSSWRIRWV
jgi:hypothetical protein